MKIVQAVRSDAFAGVERYICDAANELTRRGHSVTVVGGDPGRMVAELAPGIAHVPAPSTVEVWRALTRVAPADVVHVHMTAAEVAGAGARLFNRAPLVATRHFADPRLGRLRGAGWLVGSRLDAQISISRFVADRLGEPSVVIHNGVPNRERAGLDQRSVLMLQRLQPEKAPADGLRAWARSGLAERGWTLRIAGAGVLDTELRELAASLDLLSSVRFLGLVVDTDELFRASSIFLAPAPAEPFGLSVVEAMAHGLPVVAANGGAHRETVGGDGLVFAPGDVQMATRHLVELAGNLELRRLQGAALQDRQRERFSIDMHVDRLEALYSSIG
jgi:glycosyltransferase involved in cell wall biosynthesis